MSVQHRHVVVATTPQLKPVHPPPLDPDTALHDDETRPRHPLVRPVTVIELLRGGAVSTALILSLGVVAAVVSATFGTAWYGSIREPLRGDAVLDVAQLPSCDVLPAFRCEPLGCGEAGRAPCFFGHCGCPDPMCVLDQADHRCVASPLWVSDADRMPLDAMRSLASYGHSLTPFKRGDGECSFDNKDAAQSQARNANDGLSMEARNAATRLQREAQWLFETSEASPLLPLGAGSDWGDIGCGRRRASLEVIPRFSEEHHHDHVTSTISGICIRAELPPIAFQTAEQGRPASTSTVGGSEGESLVAKWVQSTQLIDLNTTIATQWCWASSQLHPILIPIGAQASDDMHVLLHVVSTLRFLLRAFGNNFRNVVIPVFLVASDAPITASNTADRRTNSMALFRRVFSTSSRWLSIHADPVHQGSRLDPSPLVCLPKLTHVALNRSSFLSSTAAGLAEEKATFLYLKDFLLRCIVPRPPLLTHARQHHRRVTLAWSSATPFDDFARIALPLRAYATGVLGFHSLTVIDAARLNIDTIVSIFTQTDVLIGTTGASLAWGFLLPANGVIVELALSGSCAADKSVRWTAADQCDHGTIAKALSHVHIGVPVTRFLHAGSVLRMPLEGWKRVLDAARCNSPYNDRGVSKKSCPRGFDDPQPLTP